MATKDVIAIDLGAESGRAIVGRFDGRAMDLTETHRFANEPVDMLGTLHWDLPRLWRDIKIGIGKSASFSKPVTVGVDTWGVDFGFLGSDGRLLGNPVHYRDARTENIFDYAFGIVPKSEIYRQTGLQFLRFNSLLQLLAIQREGKSDILDHARSMLFIPDLFNYFLSGQQTAEFTIASTSQMMAAKERNWSIDLMKRFGLSTSFLPTITETGTQLGPVLDAVRKETGLSDCKVIATAGHDTGSAIASVPAVGDDWCYISSGTWSLMGAELAEPMITEQSLADNFTNEGGVAGTFRFLKNIMGLWLVQECRRSFDRRKVELDYVELTNRAFHAEPFTAIVNPDDDVFMKPDDMPTAITDYCKRTGQTPPTDEGQFVRVCLESLALCYRRTLERLEANVGKRFKTIHIVGGGSKNEFLCQLTADCCGREVIAGPAEATAMGNALIQLLGLGELKSLSDLRAVVRQSYPTLHFEPHPSPRWDEAYEKFKSLLGGK